ncbi:MAG TPA: hypothetical protein EYG44_06535 [Verrucomicrobia bacterium]|nr:hypothetical protein [Verrucomicrobiota bacterium]
MSSTAISYVLSGLVFLFLVFAVSRNDNDEIAELLKSNALTIETMEQRLTDIQQTVSRQSRLINQLRAEPLGQTPAEPVPAPIDSEELMVSIEPFIEQYLDDRAQRERDEQREQMEDAMAKSRERRNQQLAKQLGLNPFQSEQLAKLRAEFQTKRREAMMPAEGESFDPTRLPEIIKQLKKEEQTRLAGFLTSDQVGQYKSRSSHSVQVMSMGGVGVSGASSEALNFSIQTLTVGAGAGDDAGAAFIFEESEIFTEGEEPGEIIFDNGEPPLPTFPPFPPPE